MAVQGVCVHGNLVPLRSKSLDFAELPLLASVFFPIAYFCATVRSAGGGDGWGFKDMGQVCPPCMVVQAILHPVCAGGTLCTLQNTI
jgi:hypothetical protein